MEITITEKVQANDEKVTICLNMIVKNESHIIRGTLEMLCNKIRFDYWVICDTVLYRSGKGVHKPDKRHHNARTHAVWGVGAYADIFVYKARYGWRGYRRW